jgi:hypothetical protein
VSGDGEYVLDVNDLALKDMIEKNVVWDNTPSH